jgi:ActR/RegA family two-component response regulator
MTEGFGNIIKLLEQRRTAIDRALVALRDIDDIAASVTTAPASTFKPKASARNNRSEGQRLRWERIRAAADKVPF